MCQCCLCMVRAITVHLARSQFGEARHSQKGPAGDKYEVELEGGTHMGFAGLFRHEDHRVEVFQCAKLETLAFWDAYLKQDPKARQYVESHGLQKFSGDLARFANK